MSAPNTVPVVYQTPEARARRRALQMLALSTVLTLLVGLSEIVVKVPTDQPVDWATVGKALLLLLLATAGETIRKYIAALGDDATPQPASTTVGPESVPLGKPGATLYARVQSDGATIYRAIQGNTTWRSADGGKTWEVIYNEDGSATPASPAPGA